MITNSDLKDLNNFCKSSFHPLGEEKFNRLSGRDRLTYLLDRFHVGMEITIAVKNDRSHGIISGFYNSNDPIQLVKSGISIPYNEMPTSPDSKIPLCNVLVMVDGELSSYYPLWIYPNFAKIRNEKLKTIGI